MTRTGVDALQRVLRRVDHRGGLRLPHRFQVGDGFATHVDVHEIGDDLHERRTRAAGMAQQFGRGRGGLAHEHVFAVEEQHARLGKLEHRVRLGARHHELLVLGAQGAALRERVDRHADQADQRRRERHDGKVEDVHDPGS
jgi:hypothetical protein